MVEAEWTEYGIILGQWLLFLDFKMNENDVPTVNDRVLINPHQLFGKGESVLIHSIQYKDGDNFERHYNKKLETIASGFV